MTTESAKGTHTPPETQQKSSEQTTPSETPRSNSFPVVGIGASAGGLEALQELLKNMPENTGMAFVVITHQHPDHTSLLPSLLGKSTGMNVAEIEDKTQLSPDHVYVAPPGSYVALMNTTLYLMEGPKGEMPPLPIDFFFRSLAEDQEDHAVCIVLSGTGTDGTVGLKAVKGHSGMAMVEDPDAAAYAGMPSSAIATGLADYIVSPAGIPGQLTAYGKAMAFYNARPPETEEEVTTNLDHYLQKIFMLIRSRTGHDFSSYKPTTMRRRIERRMNVHQIDKPEHYVRLLQETPQEADALFKDMLIGVTSFFRDPEAFRTLEENVLPELINKRPEQSQFRVWATGCGSGEEAYTLAILLNECMQKTGKSLELQVFGTDLDKKAIEVARRGEYPAGIAADVPEEYLQRYFNEDDGTYTVRKQIREMLVFAPQNVITDPPFTNLDLLVCRNLLIYLNSDLQKRLLPLFHYALKPDGLLMLGTSESIDGFTNLFEPVEKKDKIFRRREGSGAYMMPTAPPRQKSEQTQDLPVPGYAPASKPAHISSQIEKLLLDRFVPSTVVINERGDVVYIKGRTGKYLEPPAGQPNFNIYQMAREELEVHLTVAIREALSQNRDIIRERIPVNNDSEQEYVDLSVARITEPETLQGLLMVSFRPTPPPRADQEASDSSDTDTNSAVDSNAEYMEKLERELKYTKESLQSTVEELETSNEELKSTNEELQSTNEELQSSNEEMETSKEETQSLNEELTTVNAELEAKLEELSRVNNDMQNLLNSTDVATIFLDNELAIKRYTNQVKNIINVIPTDVGRPLADLGTELYDENLLHDAGEVLETLERKEKVVQTTDGTWYLMRVAPYRTTENVIEGAVITFVDISKTKRTEDAEEHARKLLQSIFDAFRQPAIVLDRDLCVERANASFYRDFHTNRKKTEGQLIYDVGGGEWDIPELRKLLEDIIPEKTSIEDYEVSGKFPKIGERVFRLNARRLERGTGLPGVILLTMDDVTSEE